VPAAAARRGDLPFGQLGSDLLDSQVVQLDQDRPQRLCISIRSALVLLSPALYCRAGRRAPWLPPSACLVLIEILRRSFSANAA
jgi:hypothetical protein